MKVVKVPHSLYTFRHYFTVLVADTTHIGGCTAGLHARAEVCETRYPSSHCPCGEYEVHWWL